jgi:hypothetical protein
MITAQDKIAITALLTSAPPLARRQVDSIDIVIGAGIRAAYARLSAAAGRDEEFGDQQAICPLELPWSGNICSNLPGGQAD